MMHRGSSYLRPMGDMYGLMREPVLWKEEVVGIETYLKAEGWGILKSGRVDRHGAWAGVSRWWVLRKAGVLR